MALEEVKENNGTAKVRVWPLGQSGERKNVLLFQNRDLISISGETSATGSKSMMLIGKRTRKLKKQIL